MNTPALLPNEQIENLQLNGLRLIQRRDSFRFSMDAVLLADFACAKKRDIICDLGTGTGVLPLLMYGRQRFAHADALEMQRDMADMAARSMALNGLAQVISVRCGDLRNIRALYQHGGHTLVVCNPPYQQQMAAPDDMAVCQRLSRFDDCCTLRDVCAAGAWLLNNGGRLCVCVPARRMAEMMIEMQAHGIEPKRLCMIASDMKKAPYLALMEGMVGARKGLAVLPQLFVYDSPGVFSVRMQAIYHLDA